MTENLRNYFLEAAGEVLRDGDDPLDRMTAAGVLGTLGDARFVPLLLAVLETDVNRQVQHKVSQAVARIGGTEAEKGLQKLMFAENQYTRYLAAEALADIVARGKA
jgi:HEAT repeat protein